MKIAACIKWVALRPDIDPLSGSVETDDRFSGVSAADQAAVEWALRMGEAWSASVAVATVGAPIAESALRDALACGATTAIRIAIDHPLTSAVVGRELAAALADADVIVCGDWSLDRGSGSVPAFLAHARGAEQACGLVALSLDAAGVVRAERRLDGGRRERLIVRAPAVLSVEGSTARLRRAPLSGVLSSTRSSIEVMTPSTPNRGEPVRLVRATPFRPRTKIVDAPHGSVRDRSNALLGMGSTRTPPQRLVLDPEVAAEHILAALHAWGEIDDPASAQGR